MADFLANPQIKWDGSMLSENPNITMFDVLAFPKNNWDWAGLSINNMRKGKERYINNKINELKFVNEFKFISKSNKLFTNVIEDIILHYLF